MASAYLAAVGQPTSKCLVAGLPQTLVEAGVPPEGLVVRVSRSLIKDDWLCLAFYKRSHRLSCPVPGYVSFSPLAFPLDSIA